METAGDCYIVAGAQMQKDEDGFLSIDNEMDAGGKGAEKVMAFAKVVGSEPGTALRLGGGGRVSLGEKTFAPLFSILFPWSGFP